MEYRAILQMAPEFFNSALNRKIPTGEVEKKTRNNYHQHPLFLYHWRFSNFFGQNFWQMRLEFFKNSDRNLQEFCQKAADFCCSVKCKVTMKSSHDLQFIFDQCYLHQIGIQVSEFLKNSAVIRKIPTREVEKHQMTTI